MKVAKVRFFPYALNCKKKTKKYSTKNVTKRGKKNAKKASI